MSRSDEKAIICHEQTTARILESVSGMGFLLLITFHMVSCKQLFVILAADGHDSFQTVNKKKIYETLYVIS